MGGHLFDTQLSAVTNNLHQIIGLPFLFLSDNQLKDLYPSLNIFDFSGQIFLKEFSEFSVEEEGDEEVIYYVTFCGVANNLHQIIKFLANTSSGHYLSEEKVLLHDFLMYVWGADLKKSIKTYFRPQRTR